MISTRTVLTLAIVRSMATMCELLEAPKPSILQLIIHACTITRKDKKASVLDDAIAENSGLPWWPQRPQLQEHGKKHINYINNSLII
jgi:hypothetical protein